MNPPTMAMGVIQLIASHMLFTWEREIPFKHKQKLDIIYFWKSGDYVLTICDAVIGDGDQGMRVAAATYLKNFTRRNLESSLSSSELYKEFRDQLAQALLRVEPAILRVLIEVVSLYSYIPQTPCG